MISLVIVNFRSANLTIDAIRSARASSREALRVIVVDNSLDPAEADRLRPHADVVVSAPSNAGYGAGLNRGASHVRGDVFIAANPDVIFSPGSIDDLVAALRDPDVAVAGPALFWDSNLDWKLPPADDLTLRSKLDEVFASRSKTWARSRDRRRIQRRLWFWRSEGTTRVTALSGAVMAIRVADFHAVGGFDERFFLYFEETDFLRRVAQRGRSILYVPSAKCRHIYDQSAGQVRDEASSAYSHSETAYLKKWYGRAAAKLIAMAGRNLEDLYDGARELPAEVPRAGLVIEASPLRSFSTAAAILNAPRDVTLPTDVWASFKGSSLHMRAIDPATGDAVAAWSLAKR